MTFQRNKLAIIMRGLPGSGKSHWIGAYLAENPLTDPRFINRTTPYRGICSTDRYFYQQGHYCFDVKKLTEYHQLNLVDFISAMAEQLPLVVCDNTNLAQWEFAAYQAAALALGYEIMIQQIGDPFDLEHQKQCAERNRHQVSLHEIRRMALRFEPIA